MPISCTLFAICIKHVNEDLKIAAYDFTIYYWGLACLIYQIIGIIFFTTHENSFDWGLWINGFLASLFNLLGCMWVLSCFATGCAMGPASAFVSTQTVAVVIVTAII